MTMNHTKTALVEDPPIVSACISQTCPSFSLCARSTNTADGVDYFSACSSSGRKVKACEYYLSRRYANAFSIHE